jgi:orotidine-5'-phosphate decarboxylase
MAHIMTSSTAAELARPIVALDVHTEEAVRSLVRSLGESCRFYKVGSELFTALGPDIVRWLRDEGCDVFLDLKLHDIPATMRGGARSAAALGARLLTVHAAAGQAGIAAAVDGAGEACGILAVTVLTSFDAAGIARVWGRDLVDVPVEVLRLAEIAAAGGAHGIVCSGHELSAVRARLGQRLAPLVPGIRLAGGDTHDQARTMTPAEAQRLGARYLVLGRAVTQAPSPRAAMDRVWADLGSPPATAG